MRIIRAIAQLVDIFICIAILTGAFIMIPPLLLKLGVGSTAAGAIVLAAALLVSVGIQYPFLKIGQTIGKAFFGLAVDTEVLERPVTASIMLQREIFLKLFTCWFICIPVLLGAPGGHEIATQTRVIRRKGGQIK